MSAYLINGLSGTGKSTVEKELRRQGFRTIETDSEPGLSSWFHTKTGAKIPNYEPLPEHTAEWIHEHTWSWDLRRLHESMKRCLQSREPERWYDGSAELERMLGWNRGYRQNHASDGTIFIDSSKPVNQIVDEIMKYVHAS